MKRQSTIELASIHESEDSISDLREILAHTETTPFPSQASTPTWPGLPTRFERMASQMTCPIIAEESSDRYGTEPDRPLSRCLSEIRPAPPPNPQHHPTRRFSLFRRPSSRSTVDRRASCDFTSAWLKTSNFDLREAGGQQESDNQPVEEQETMGIPTQNEALDHVRFSDHIERPVQLTRIDSNYSISENDSENGSTTDIDKTPESAETTWMRDKKAKTSLLTACTVFYALFLTIFSLVLELAHLLNDEESRKLNKKDIIFGLYMYGGSLLFFFYMYIVLLLNPRWYSTMDYLGKMFGVCLTRPKVSPSSDSLSSAAATVRKVTHSSPSAGSLFLRLGSVVFGVTGVVYYAFLVFLCDLDPTCSGLSISLDICAILFIFIQMHFIFCNWKLSITGSHMVARIGTMHLVAANLWTWIRYVLMEEGVMEKEIREVFKHRPLENESSSESSFNPHRNLFSESSREDEHDKKNFQGSCQAVECFLGSLSEIMFTSIVEYSLIAAAVMYIVWRNIGRQDQGSTYIKRKHQIRVDCSKTTTGLFLGLAFLAVTFTSMVVYYGFTMMNRSQHAAYVYAFTDMFQYVLSTIGVLTAIYQMRALKYFNKKTHILNSDQELLDQILLSVGLVGELIYSVAGLVGLTGEKEWKTLSFILLFVHIFRLIQVGTQTFLLHVARSVRMGGGDREAQPGKQAITFLLTANLAIFFMNLFESEKAGVSEVIIDADLTKKAVGFSKEKPNFEVVITVHQPGNKEKAEEAQKISFYLEVLETLKENTERRKFHERWTVWLDKIVLLLMIGLSFFFTRWEKPIFFYINLGFIGNMWAIYGCYRCLKKWEESVLNIKTCYESLQPLFSKCQKEIRNGEKLLVLRNEARKLIFLNPRPTLTFYFSNSLCYIIISLMAIFVDYGYDPMILISVGTAVITVGTVICFYKYDSIHRTGFRSYDWIHDELLNIS